MTPPRPRYPFAALVGLEDLKTALLLAAIDGRLGVLVRGDKGAGKSTAARALAGLLADEAPFVNLPIGATEDRLLGGLDVERAMRGEPALKPGLLSRAHGGVLYIDEVNLLPDHLADALLDAAAGGVHLIEREGFSASHDARFVLIGSMNPEEGTLRPQLLDRFALAVDVDAPALPADRRLAVERRLAFEAAPDVFDRQWRAEQDRLREQVQAAGRLVARVVCPPGIIEWAGTLVCEHGVRSLRADLAIVAASRALAALQGVESVSEDHIRAVFPLALAHRTRQPRLFPPGPHLPPQGPPPRLEGSPEEGSADRSEIAPADRVFAPRPVAMPRVEVSGQAGPDVASGSTAYGENDGRGTAIRARRTAAPLELDARATLTHAVARTGGVVPGSDDLHEKVRQPRAGTRFLFIVDSSGSQAAHERMRLVKGAVTGLLAASARRHDEVAVIAFRGTSAEMVLEPTDRLADAERALAYLPTGGRTPLAHGLDLAARHVTGRTVVVLLTDGRANVPLASDDPWVDAIAAAARIQCPAIVVDAETGPQPLGRSKLLADAMRAAHVRLDGLDAAQAIRLVLERASPGAARA